MVVEDLTQENVKLYCMCLEDWSDEMKESGDHKKHWYCFIKDKGLRVKLAKDENGEIGGMIQYVPVEYSPVEGEKMYFVNCIWVHGYNQGRGNFQKKGYGKALLKAAEDDVKSLGASGLAVWGINLPFWMKASWFKKQGYEAVDKDRGRVLLWKPFTSGAVHPSWIRLKNKPEPVKGKVTVSAFLNGWCPAQNIVFERAKRAALELGNKVVFNFYNTSDREMFLKWGILDALYIDGKEVTTGPPPSYEKIRRKIAKRLKKLG